MHIACCGFRMRQVWPICGDGIDLEIRHTLAGSAESKQLMWRTIAPDPKDKPQRQKVRGVLLRRTWPSYHCWCVFA